MNIRPATIDDARRLYEWRNDPLTRAMSKNTEPVPWDSHVRWFSARLARDEPRLYVAEVEGEPIGTLRIDDGEVSYTVAPEHRGKGYSTQMLVWARERFGPLRAEIKPDNRASIQAATRAGHIIVVI